MVVSEFFEPLRFRDARPDSSRGTCTPIWIFLHYIPKPTNFPVPNSICPGWMLRAGARGRAHAGTDRACPTVCLSPIAAREAIFRSARGRSAWVVVGLLRA